VSDLFCYGLNVLDNLVLWNEVIHTEMDLDVDANKFFVFFKMSSEAHNSCTPRHSVEGKSETVHVCFTFHPNFSLRPVAYLAFSLQAFSPYTGIYSL
jgi:hypothetical protein